MRKGMRRDERTPLASRFWEKVEKSDSCWIWTGCVDQHGYGQIAIGGKDGGHIKAHRAAMQIAGHSLTSEQHVLHRCDNPRCVRVEHLFVGDHTDNMRDMWAKGRGRCESAGRLGSQNGNHRLTEPQVVEIYRRHRNGESSRKLGAEFGVSKTLVIFISNGKVWTHITGATQ